MGSQELYHIRFVVFTPGAQIDGVVMLAKLRVESVDGVYTQALSIYHAAMAAEWVLWRWQGRYT
jgi:hypothetical protein